MQQSIYVGLDLGSSRCHQTVINADGSLQMSRSIPTSEQHLRLAFATRGDNVRVHLESGELADWVSSIIKPMVAEVIVSHSRTLAWIGKDSQKDDAIDARKLAELLRLNRTHPVYCQTDDSRRLFKQLVTHHENLSREQARLKSKIKARLRCLGIIRFDARLFTKSGQSALLSELKEPAVKLMLAQIFAVLNQLLEAETEAKQAMTQASRQFPEVSLLQTAPGASHDHRLPVRRLRANAASFLEQKKTLAILSLRHHQTRIERQTPCSSAPRQCRCRLAQGCFAQSF